MRKVFVFMMTSLDGFFEAANPTDLSWHHVDDEFNVFAVDQVKEVDTLIFGRVTYEGMASYWPTDAAKADDPIVAKQMNSINKIVFSKSLDKVDWENTTLIKDEAAVELQKLKSQPGKDMAIFGSSKLCASLIDAGVVDELRIMVNPVLIGAGTSVFAGLTKQHELELIKTRNFKNGNVLLFYKVPNN